MRFFQKLIISATLLLAVQAKAFTPESGFWINPNIPGTGYAIEIQDNFMFVALYVYDSDGNPIWYTAGTTLGGNSFFDTNLDYTYNGTCIDCSVTQPITLIGERGPITIEFLTETTATIQFQGSVQNIQRFNFLLGNETTRMLGEWQTVIDFSSTGVDFPFNGDILLFDITTNSDNVDYAEGCRPDNSNDGFCSNFALDNHDLAAIYDYQENELLAVVSDDADFWLAYYVDLGLNQFDGFAETYPKDGSHNNIFYPVRGFRTASRSFIETGVGPAKLAKSDGKKVAGIATRMKIDTNKHKPLSSFSKKEQAKILRRHTIVQTLINRLQQKKKTK